ncbi:oxidoreductase [Brytella acorum]|uniref:Oxidoreductase n=1 Tax=Brytella acorum TaxID=2959299 RepID=A0AA35UKW6_9PROT|nr:oxidoreductase [Brytella acorum]CAI9119302.1 oxidoreductase [Brytella acorum]
MAGSGIRVGLIGYGFVGKTFHGPMIAATSGMTLVAVASSRPREVGRDYPDVEVVPTPEDLIARDDLDLVVIASPNETHRLLAEAALRSGKNVLVDKPFMLSLSDARSVVETARLCGKSVSVFQNRRWDSDFLGVKSVIDSGRLGRIAHFESHIEKFDPVPGPGWRDAFVPGAGMWFDLAPHMVDQALLLFGLPTAVTAEIAVIRPESEVDDWFEVILRYPTHRVTLHGSMVVAGGTSRFSVHGAAGSLIKHGADRQEDRLKQGCIPGSPGFGDDDDAMMFHKSDGETETLPTPPGDQMAFYRALAAALRGEKPNPVSTNQALGVMAVIETAIEASKQGRTLPLPLSAEERAGWARAEEALT